MNKGSHSGLAHYPRRRELQDAFFEAIRKWFWAHVTMPFLARVDLCIEDESESTDENAPTPIDCDYYIGVTPQAGRAPTHYVPMRVVAPTDDYGITVVPKVGTTVMMVFPEGDRSRGIMTKVQQWARILLKRQDTSPATPPHPLAVVDTVLEVAESGTITVQTNDTQRLVIDPTLVQMEYVHPSGTTFKVNADGSVDVTTASKLNATVLGDMSATVWGNMTTDVWSNMNVTVFGNQTSNVLGLTTLNCPSIQFNPIV